ncbi:MAG: FkbM family methyltransferase, partial [Leadbetterella sp.]|nr:FkbM family methyltransferase [Leadbetterella sp.]
KRRELYEPKTGIWMKNIVASGWVCADVGANIGIITDRLAEQVGTTGTVIAFEPHPENFRRLKVYNKLNIQKGIVKVENIAVTDGSTDYVWLYPGRDYSAGEWNIRGCDINGIETEASLKVSAASLDAFFPEDYKVDLIKIDVEGSGYKVLAGAKRILQRFRPIIFMEFHTDEEWSSRNILISLDYNIYDLNGDLISLDENVKREYLCFAIPMEQVIPPTS